MRSDILLLAIALAVAAANDSGNSSINIIWLEHRVVSSAPVSVTGGTTLLIASKAEYPNWSGDFTEVRGTLALFAAKDGDFIADDFDEPKVGPLSKREIEVLTYIARGKTHEEIGIIGDISAETVRTHMKSILRKLDCANAPAAVSRAYELGILRA